MMGCTTLHVDKAYYVDRESLPVSAKPVCERSGSYGDEVVLGFGSNSYITVSLSFGQGFTAIGALFVPFIPVRFSASVDEITLNIVSAPEILFDPEQLEIRVDGGKWIPGKREFVHPDWYAGCQTENCKKKYPPYVRFVLPSSQSPKRVEVKLTGLTSSGHALPEMKMVFQRQGNWHYEPIVMLHSEWPYSHLPCAH